MVQRVVEDSRAHKRSATINNARDVFLASVYKHDLESWVQLQIGARTFLFIDILIRSLYVSKGKSKALKSDWLCYSPVVTILALSKPSTERMKPVSS